MTAENKQVQQGRTASDSILAPGMNKQGEPAPSSSEMESQGDFMEDLEDTGMSRVEEVTKRL